MSLGWLSLVKDAITKNKLENWSELCDYYDYNKDKVNATKTNIARTNVIWSNIARTNVTWSNIARTNVWI